MDATIYLEMRKVEDEHWWFRARRLIVSRLIAGLGLPPHARLLDVGCGTGGNLAMLREFGHVTGLELDAAARAMAVRRGVCEVVPGRLPDGLSNIDDRYDLMVMLDVLEHIDEDVAALRNLRPHLAPGGRLLLTVPAFAFLWGPHDVAHHHKRRYTKRLLTARLAEAGYRLDLASYYNTWLFPMVAAVRLLESRRSGPAATGLACPPGPVNWLLTRVMASERALLPRPGFPFGVSLIAVARPAD